MRSNFKSTIEPLFIHQHLWIMLEATKAESQRRKRFYYLIYWNTTQQLTLTVYIVVSFMLFKNGKHSICLCSVSTLSSIENKFIQVVACTIYSYLIFLLGLTSFRWYSWYVFGEKVLAIMFCMLLFMFKVYWFCNRSAYVCSFLLPLRSHFGNCQLIYRQNTFCRSIHATTLHVGPI